MKYDTNQNFFSRVSVILVLGCLSITVQAAPEEKKLKQVPTIEVNVMPGQRPDEVKREQIAHSHHHTKNKYPGVLPSNSKQPESGTDAVVNENHQADKTQ